MFVLLLVSIRSLVLLGHGSKFFCFFYLKNPLFRLNKYNIYNWFLTLNILSSFIISESLKSASSWSLTSVWSCRNILWYNFSWPWTSHPTRSSSLSRQLSPFSSWTRISSGKSMSWHHVTIWLHFIENFITFQSCLLKIENKDRPTPSVEIWILNKEC